VKPIVGGRPSWWTRWDITSGLFSVVVLVWIEIAGAGAGLELELWLELGVGAVPRGTKAFWVRGTSTSAIMDVCDVPDRK
jgi:hypothetical protein